MSQQAKITKRLSLNNTAQIVGYPTYVSKTANYTIQAYYDSSKTFLPNNSQQIIYFTLPQCNSCMGEFWNFWTTNTGTYTIIAEGASNNIFSALSVNAAHKVQRINVCNLGVTAQVYSDGTRYYAFTTSTIANVAGFKEG